ncbi:MAG: hypothetical protein GY801_39010, partial [bacterium]|nr:hypothetical protein [bacterium]
VKGLHSFQPEDAEIFARLQRQDAIKECLTAITYPDFRFGILTGESGCGKTSFLHAGLTPALLNRGYTCIYVKFTDINPLDSIRYAIIGHIQQARKKPETSSTVGDDGLRKQRLPFGLHQKITNFLRSLPNIQESNAQRALLLSAGIDAEVHQQLSVGVAPTQFVQVLVNTLQTYGMLADGRNALVAVLEAAKQNVGQEGKMSCDKLIQDIQSISSEGGHFTPTPHSIQEELASADFLTLLDIIVQYSTPHPVVFLFDQFEQFFTHHPSQQEQHAFLQAMTTWFKELGRMPIKILFSIRSDFTDKLYQFQEAMGYSLIARQNYFCLMKFTPDEATAICRQMAAAEKLGFDAPFVKGILAKELASREDMLISPV